MDGFLPNPKLKLREQLGEVMRFKHFSRRTANRAVSCRREIRSINESHFRRWQLRVVVGQTENEVLADSGGCGWRCSKA
jgi:hypothetical protein